MVPNPAAYCDDTPSGAEAVNNVIDFDTAAHGEMLPWANECLRTQRPAMLTEAEGGHLVARLDADVIGPVVDEVQRIAEQAQQARRAASHQ